MYALNIALLTAHIILLSTFAHTLLTTSAAKPTIMI